MLPVLQFKGYWQDYITGATSKIGSHLEELNWLRAEMAQRSAVLVAPEIRTAYVNDTVSM